mmetsp:Transcript_161/g.355  ORF Transcript_161/g.355 Transcript_161/m.355 type:complete len:165 (+) Transcript_161:748-1242(+)
MPETVIDRHPDLQRWAEPMPQGSLRPASSSMFRPADRSVRHKCGQLLPEVRGVLRQKCSGLPLLGPPRRGQALLVERGGLLHDLRALEQALGEVLRVVQFLQLELDQSRTDRKVLSRAVRDGPNLLRQQKGHQWLLFVNRRPGACQPAEALRKAEDTQKGHIIP